MRRRTRPREWGSRARTSLRRSGRPECPVPPWSRGTLFQKPLFDIEDLLDPRLMPAAGERRGQPGAQNVLRLALGQEPAAKCKHIGIIVFPAVSGGSFIIAQRRADTRSLVAPSHR